MAALTLYDMIKDMKDPTAQAISFIYLEESPVLQFMTWATRTNGTMKNMLVLQNPYTTSTTAYRNFNAEFGTTKVPKQEFTTNVKLAGGRFEYDREAQKINPEETRTQMKAQIRANVHVISKDIFEGAGGSGIYGINSWIVNQAPWSGQSVDCGGNVLTLNYLDDAMALHNTIPGRTAIFMAKIPYLVLKSLERSSANSSYNVNWLPGQWGADPKVYAGVPVIQYTDGAGNDYFAGTTNINGYIVTFGEDQFEGFQTGVPYISTNNTNSVMISNSYNWTIGTMPKNIKCITRLLNIKNARA